MKNFLLILALSATATSLLAQTPLPPVSPSSATQIEVFPIYSLNTAPVAGATLTVVGQAGPAPYCYWAVTNYQVGSIGPTPLGCVQNGPNTLSGSNYVKIAAFGYPAGTTGLDILENTTPLIPPNGACNCAVATGVTSGTVSQTSNTLSSYTVASFNPNVYALTLSAETVGSDSVHFLLRQGWPWPGTLVADLSAASGGECAEGTCVVNAPTANQEISGAFGLDLTDAGSEFSVANQALIVTSTLFTYGDLGGAGFEVSGGAIVFGDQAGDEIDMAAGMTFGTLGGGFSFTDTSGGTFTAVTTGGGFGFADTSGGYFNVNVTDGVEIHDNSTVVIDLEENGSGPETFTATGGGFVFSDTSGGTFGSNTTGGVGITDQSSPGMDFDEAGTGPVAMDANGGGFSFSDTAGGNFQVTTNTILASTQLCADSDNNFISTGPNCSVLVASLPAAASGNAGQVRSVSDSTTIATEGQTCAGGSTHTALAFSNGTVWKCF